MTDQLSTVLFLCTHNSVRSQLAEALLKSRDGRYFETFSAGSEPAPDVDPLTIETLEEKGIEVEELQPKSYSAFTGIPLDYVFSFGDEKVDEYPLATDNTVKVNWTLPDPLKFKGSEEDKKELFRRTTEVISELVTQFIQHYENPAWRASSTIERTQELTAALEQILNQLDQTPFDYIKLSDKSHKKKPLLHRFTANVIKVIRGRDTQREQYIAERTARMKEKITKQGEGGLVVDSIEREEGTPFYKVHHHYNPEVPLLSQETKQALLSNAPTNKRRKELEKDINQLEKTSAPKKQG